MKALATISLLLLSNLFMTLAWYGHLKFSEYKATKNYGLLSIILISWIIAFIEYCFMVPANRIGFKEQGGPFSLMQLKVIQEVISILVFVFVATFLFKGESLRTNHIIAFSLIVLAVYFVFKN